MKKLFQLLLFTVACGAIGLVASLAPPKSAGGAVATNVNVVNTPLPISGAVNATIAGTPTVNVASAPPVSVNFPSTENVSGSSVVVDNVEGRDANNNPAPQPLATRDTGDAAYEPATFVVCYAAPSNTCPAEQTSVSVPSKTTDFNRITRLVIESISGFCVSVGGSATFLGLFTNASGTSNEPASFIVENDFLLDPPDQFGAQSFSQVTRIYADPGSHLGMTPRYGSVSGSITCTAAVNGHFVVSGVPPIF